MITLRAKKVYNITPDGETVVITIDHLHKDCTKVMLDYVNESEINGYEKIIDFHDPDTVIERLVEVFGKDRIRELTKSFTG